jgi:hypothetical protein
MLSGLYNAILKDFMRTTPRMLLPFTGDNKYTYITHYCVKNITYTMKLRNCFTMWAKMASPTCKLSAIEANPWFFRGNFKHVVCKWVHPRTTDLLCPSTKSRNEFSLSKLQKIITACISNETCYNYAPITYRVSQEERSIFWEVKVSVILRKKTLYEHVSYSKRFPRWSHFSGLAWAPSIVLPSRPVTGGKVNILGGHSKQKTL